jgi:D-serine deaminase-like pyridoxal phosphate-dependent protein
MVAVRPGTPLNELDTPALIVDLDRMEANIRDMAALVANTGKHLRPHAKAHKIPALAWKQIEAGACGITCQKLGEAEVLADAGIQNILVAIPIVGPIKIDRLAQLARRCHITTVVDSLAAARRVSDGIGDGSPIDTLIEVDIGYRRCGVSPDGALDLARSLVETCPMLRIRGILAYEGHLYDLSSDDVVSAATTAYDLLGSVADRLRAAGIPVECVSVGASSAARIAVRHPAITEIRAGSYIFHDRAQIAMGGATEDECALTILATVVSTPTEERVVIDSGAKAVTLTVLTGVHGYGSIRGYESAVLDRLSDEHGMITVLRGRRPAVGERLQIVPNSGSGVVNQFSELIGVRDGVVECVWAIAAQGRMQ